MEQFSNIIDTAFVDLVLTNHTVNIKFKQEVYWWDTMWLKIIDAL